MWRRNVSKSASNASSPVESFGSITSGLSDFYQTYLLPLEKDFRYSQFFSPIMTDGDFKAKPMVLLVGQYSTGKVSWRHKPQ